MWFKKTHSMSPVESLFTNSHHKTSPWPKRIMIFIVIIILLALIFLIPLVVQGVRIAGQIKNVNSQVTIVTEALSQKDFKATNLGIKNIKINLLSIQNEINHLGLITWVPPFKQKIVLGDQLLGAAVSLLSSYDRVFMLVGDMKNSPDLEQAFSDLNNPAKRQTLLKSLVDNQDTLSKINNELLSARLILKNINSNDFNGFGQDKLTEIYNTLNQLADSSELAIPLLQKLPQLVGYKQAKTYLLVFQNNTELRPTGGFIGSYGLITIEDGEIKNFTTDDVYNLDKLVKDKMQIPAPWPINAFISQKYWFMRDANWSPDWPTSAQQIAWFFGEERRLAGLPPQQVDGVIALNPDFVANLLDVIGPIVANNVVFDSQNFTRDLEQFVEFDYAKTGIPIEQRKAIIGNLVGEIINRVSKLPPKDLIKIWLAFKKNIDEKQILAYTKDEDLEQYFIDNDWAGVVMATDGDYAMVVDSNLASLKTDQAMKKGINYSLHLDSSGDLIGRLEIIYQHNSAPVKDLVTRYRNYARIYLPTNTWILKGYTQQGSQQTDLKIGSDLQISKDLNKTVVATFLTIEPLTTKILVLEYRLPENIKQQYQKGLYKLIVQKQPGINGQNLKIDLKFDKNIAAYHAVDSPSIAGIREMAWQMAFKVDKELIFKF